MQLKRVLIIALFTAVLLLAAACGKTTPSEPTIHPDRALVQSYVDAYNDRNLDEMSDLMHEEIVWINIEGSAQTLVTEYKETLVLELRSYFASDPKSVSALSDWSINGKYVSAKETVTFTRKDGSQGSQASVSVYELQDGLIRRVWYFPAQ